MTRTSTIGTIRRQLIEALAEVSGIDAERIDGATPIERYGVNSTMIVELNAALATRFAGLPSTLFFEFETLDALAEHIGRRRADERLDGVAAGATAERETRADAEPGQEPSVAPAAAEREEDADAEPGREEEDWSSGWLAELGLVPGASAAPGADDAIAIVGMAARYPQADDLDAFWQNLLAGRDSVGPVPAERWDVDEWYDPHSDDENAVYSRWGGFLDDVHGFDARFFGISPREAKRMDPQERLFLQVAWHCIENAGYAPGALRGTRTAVLVGVMWGLYQLYGAESTARGEPDVASSSFASIANRLSWQLDLKGPSLALDSMCSSSLAALHLARQSLLRGECEQAIVGGVNLSVHPAKYLHLCRGGFASRDGRCRAFGDGGSGYVPGEGVGAVLLKPLERALEEGDVVHAVLAGTALSHGGRSRGYTVPDPRAQADCLREALADSGLAARDVRYVEAHGTGTALGDPIEIEGLLRCYGEREDVLRIGSVKSNIGHLEAAAGIAGLHKLVLQIRHGRLVPSLHAEPLNGNVRWDEIPLRVQTQGETLRLGAGEAMALSAFGAGGSNAHALVCPPPARAAARRVPAAPARLPILLSARGAAALRLSRERLAAWLERHGRGLALADLAHTLIVGRDHFAERFLVVVDDIGTLAARLVETAPERAEAAELAALGSGWADALERWLRGEAVPSEMLWPHPPRPRIALPGQVFESRVHRLAPPFGPRGLRASTGASPALFRGRWEPLAPPQAAATATATAAPERLLHTPEQTPLARRLAERLGCPAEALCPVQRWREAVEDARSVLDIAVGAGDEDRLVRAERLGWLQRRLRARAPLDYLMLAVGADLGRRLDAELVRLLPFEYRRLRAASCTLPSWDEDAAVRLWQALAGGRLAAGAKHRLRDERLERLDFGPQAPGALRWRPDPCATHLITGGTGGIGLALARWLCRHGAEHLVLGGRRTLPPRERWSSLLADAGTDAALRARLECLRPLPAGVSVVDWDLGDARALHAHLAELAETRPLGTVIHLAGEVDGATPAFVDKTVGSIAAVSGGKVDGADNLLRSLDALGAERLLLVSSQCTAFPELAAGVVDYAAANGVLVDLASAPRAGAPLPVQTLLLPNWRGAGLGDTRSPHYGRLGLSAVDEAEGLKLFHEALSCEADVLLGVAHDARFDLASALRPRAAREATVEAGAPSSVLGPDAAPPEAASDAGDGAAPGEAARAEPDAERAVMSPPATAALVAALTRRFAPLLELSAEEWAPGDDFAELGVDSIMLLRLAAALESALGAPVAAERLIEFGTLERLAGWLLAEHGTRLDALLGDGAVAPRQAAPDAPAEAGVSGQGRTSAEGAEPERERARSPRIASASSDAEDRGIALVGIGALLPDAEGPERLWQNLLAGHDAVREVPPDRWPVEAYFGADGGHGTPSKWGGFVDGLERFDASAYGLPAEAAACSDPLLRVALWSVHGALCDAGLVPEALDGQRVGVFIGSRVANWAERLPRYHRDTVLGTAQNFIAAHVAHWLNLRGPAWVVDSACSSSLLAVHQGCASLLSGECDVALAGGSEVLLDERPYQMLGRTGALSPSGRCRTFDSEADGFVPGEGGGVVVLKRLHRALTDGDSIYCVIEGSAVNNDGRTMGVTTPSPEAQQDVIRRALRQAGATPDALGYVEAHGTGTALGDPMELRALERVFREGTQRRRFCGVGSVKSSLGHLLSAAGAAALLKAALCVAHGMLVPTLHCRRPNPRFGFDASPFYPVRERAPFEPRDGLRRAGVSAFGFGGTNVHLQLSDRHLRLACRPARSRLPPPQRRGPRAWYPRPARAEDRPGTADRTAADTGFALVRSY